MKPISAMKTSRNPKRAVGFTLIELLVVIAIIAILAALLLPALAGVKNRSQMVTDVNNCKQIMLSCIMYGSGNDDHFPQSGWDMAAKNWGANSTAASVNPMQLGPATGGALSDFMTLYGASDTTPQKLAFKSGLFGSYLQNPAILRCPADIENAMFYARRQYLTSYMMNGAVNRYALGDTVKFSDPQVLGSRIALWENDEKRVPTAANGNAYQGQWNDFANYPDEGVSTRHGDGAMVASVDGSATRMDMRDFYQLAGTYPTGNPAGGGGAGTGKGYASPAAPNDLWWFP